MFIFIVGPSKRTYEFQAPERFREGHRLTRGEARALNLLLCEAISKNQSNAIRKVELATPEGIARLEDLAVLQGRIEKYAADYEFQDLPPRARRGDIEVEAMLVAALREGGPEDLAIRREARERLISKRDVALKALEELVGE